MLGSCSRNGSIAVSKKRNMVQNPPGIAATAGFKSEAANKRMRTETMRGCGFRRPDASASSQAAITVNAWPIGQTPAVGADGVRNCVELNSFRPPRVRVFVSNRISRGPSSAREDPQIHGSTAEVSRNCHLRQVPAKVLYVGDSCRGDEPAQQCHSLPAIEADAREVLCIHGRPRGLATPCCAAKSRTKDVGRRRARAL